MNQLLSDLEARARAALPHILIESVQTKDPERFGALDLRDGNRMINVMWSPEDGLCITEVTEASVFDDTPDYVLRSVDEALQILLFLLAHSELNDLDGMDAPPRKAA